MARKVGMNADYEVNKTGQMSVKQWYNSKNQKVGQDYVDAVFKSVSRQKMLASAISVASVSVGSAVLFKMLNK